MEQISLCMVESHVLGESDLTYVSFIKHITVTYHMIM